MYRVVASLAELNVLELETLFSQQFTAVPEIVRHTFFHSFVGVAPFVIVL